MHGPAFRHEIITPSDTAKLDRYISVIFVNGGTARIEDRDGGIIDYENIPPYTTFENFMPLRIHATGTDAGLKIVGWRLEE